jgi:hypothetical protein
MAKGAYNQDKKQHSQSELDVYLVNTVVGVSFIDELIAEGEEGLE